eukprot:5029623-Amphidinium_carterae.1
MNNTTKKTNHVVVEQCGVIFWRGRRFGCWGGWWVSTAPAGSLNLVHMSCDMKTDVNYKHHWQQVSKCSTTFTRETATA